MEIKKIQTIRARFDDGFYCDITQEKNNGVCEFWLYRNGYGFALFMFGCTAETEQEKIELAAANIKQYIPIFEKSCE